MFSLITPEKRPAVATGQGSTPAVKAVLMGDKAPADSRKHQRIRERGTNISDSLKGSKNIVNVVGVAARTELNGVLGEMLSVRPPGEDCQLVIMN